MLINQQFLNAIEVKLRIILQSFVKFIPHNHTNNYSAPISK